MKKAAAVLLGMAFMLSCFCAAVCAESTGQWHIQKQSDGTCTVTGFVGAEEQLVIPSEIEGHTVTAIGDMAFTSNSSFVSVTIPDGVTSIGKQAFYWCSNLQSVSIPDSVEEIGEGAFGKCYALSELTLPKALTAFDPLTVHYCRALTALNIHEDNAVYTSVDGVLYTKDMTTLVFYPPQKDETVYTVSDGVTYTVPDGVTTIGAGAFDDCPLLHMLVLPESIRTMEDGAFVGCRDLKTVEYCGTQDAWEAVALGDNAVIQEADVVFSPRATWVLPSAIGGVLVLVIAVIVVVLLKRKTS